MMDTKEMAQLAVYLGDNIEVDNNFIRMGNIFDLLIKWEKKKGGL